MEQNGLNRPKWTKVDRMYRNGPKSIEMNWGRLNFYVDNEQENNNNNFYLSAFKFIYKYRFVNTRLNSSLSLSLSLYTYINMFIFIGNLNSLFIGKDL